jgi:hypothetical protein
LANPCPTVPEATALLEILGDLAVPDSEIDQIFRLRPRIEDHELVTFWIGS